MKDALPEFNDWLFLEEYRNLAAKLKIAHSMAFQWWAAATTLVFAVIVLVSAHLAHADLLVLIIKAKLRLLDQPTEVLAVSDHVYGYFGEFNHGFFYLVVAPTFVWLALQFCRQVGQSVQEMLRTGLIKEKEAGAVEGFIRKINNDSWRVLIFCLFVTSFLNIITEYGSLWRLDHFQEVNRDTPGATPFDWSEIGYVQTPYLTQWVNIYNERSDGDRVEAITGKSFNSQLGSRLASQLLFKAKFSHLNLSSLEQQGLLISNQAVDPQFTSFNLNGAAKVGMVTLTAETPCASPTYGWRRLIAFHLFLFLALLMESIFQGFGGWVVFKMGVFVYLMYNLLPHRGSKQFEICPWLDDSERHFGMDAAFGLYNLIALTISVGSSFLLLQGMNTLDARDGALAFPALQILQVLGLIAVACALLILLAGPAILFRGQLRTLQDNRLRVLEQRLGKAADGDRPKNRKALIEEIRLIKSQTTWPRADAAFLATVAFSLVCLVFPFPPLFGLAPNDAQNWVSLAERIGNEAHEILKSWYHFESS